MRRHPREPFVSSSGRYPYSAAMCQPNMPALFRPPALLRIGSYIRAPVMPNDSPALYRQYALFNRHYIGSIQYSTGTVSAIGTMQPAPLGAPYLKKKRQSLGVAPATCSQRVRISSKATCTWWHSPADQPSGRRRHATVNSSDRFLMEYATPTPASPSIQREGFEAADGWVGG